MTYQIHPSSKNLILCKEACSKDKNLILEYWSSPIIKPLSPLPIPSPDTTQQLRHIHSIPSNYISTSTSSTVTTSSSHDHALSVVSPLETGGEQNTTDCLWTHNLTTTTTTNNQQNFWWVHSIHSFCQHSHCSLNVRLCVCGDMTTYRHHRQQQQHHNNLTSFPLRVVCVMTTTTTPTPKHCCWNNFPLLSGSSTSGVW